MPRRPPHPCAHQGCPNVTRERYCEAHAAESSRYDQERGSASSRGYGASWRKLRAWYLARNPLCVMCGKAAREVDHILPREDGGTDDQENLQSLCKSCHSKKTNREKREREGRVKSL